MSYPRVASSWQELSSGVLRAEKWTRQRLQVQAIVADWAGTTLDFGSRAPASVFRQVFQQRGIDVTVAEAREPMGMAKREHIATMTRMESIARQWQARFGRAATDDDVQRMYDEFLPLQKEVLKQHADIIPGTVETVAYCQKHGIRVGSTTGYTVELMEVVLPAARLQGYAPDVVVCSDDVPAGRPAPWMCLEAARRLGVYPLETVIKLDDTLVGITAGHHAGAWTVGIAETGNEMALSQQELEQLDATERTRRVSQIREKFFAAGAHYVIDSIACLPAVIEDVNARLSKGQLP